MPHTPPDKRATTDLGTSMLATYTYTDDQNKYLASIDYGNEDSVKYDYDNYGRLITQTYEDGDTVTYNGTTYYYVKNLQGDVVAILDASGNAVVEYTYNAWGVLLSTTGSMASTLGLHNPLRYRGYVYDPETALYYLQSRYYDPDVGRFINADSLVDTRSLVGHNMFAYCWNNPVMYVDHNGEAAEVGVLAWGAYVGGANAWNPAGWVITTVVVTVVVTNSAISLYKSHKAYQAKVNKINNENLNKKVKDILKTKKGSIKNAKLPKGSPSWNDIMDLTLAEIYRRAQKGDPGFNYFEKLLTDGRFNK